MLRKALAEKMRPGPARNMFTMVSGSLIGQLIALAAYPVITRLYNPTEFGIQSVFMTLGVLASAVATGRYEQGLLLPKEDRQAGRMMMLVVLITSLFALVITLPCILWRHGISVIFRTHDLIRWLPFLSVYTWVLALSSAFNLYANRYGRYGLMAGYQVVQSGGTAGLRIGLSTMGSSGLIAGTILGQVTGFLTLALPQLKRLRRENTNGSKSEISTIAKEYRNFPMYKMPGLFVIYLSGNIPVFVFSGFFSPAIAGFYSLAYTTVFRPVNLLISNISQVFAQQFIRRQQEEKDLFTMLRRHLKRLVMLGSGPFLLAFFLAPLLFSFIFGKEWETAGTYLRWMIPWMFTFYLYSGLNFIPDMFSKQRKAMILDSSLLVLRVAALSIGVWKKDPMLAVVLFSLTGLIIQTYCIFWYLRLARTHDTSLR